MSAHAPPRAASLVPVAVVSACLGLLAVATVAGVAPPIAAVAASGIALVALARPAYLPWPNLVAALILIILFIPIRRYTLPANLPFQLEPYRVFVALLVVGWLASLLVDSRMRFRKTGFEGPLIVVVGAALASIVANPERVAAASGVVDKKLMFFISFILVVYLVVSVIRRLDSIDLLARTLVAGGAVVALFAIVEARTGFNVFSHLSRAVPILRPGELNSATGDFVRYGTAKLRVFGSAEHPIALSAMFVMLAPLALYLARRYKQRRWTLCAIGLVAACASTVSRTGILMFVVVGLVFLWLRPRETRRLWPLIIPALIVIKLVLPGTLGAIKQSFLPAGGLIAEQRSSAGGSGSGRLADLGPALEVWTHRPLVGQGYGTHLIVNSSPAGPEMNILDDQWLGTLLETGIIGFAGWIWFFARAIRRFGTEARTDQSERGWLLAAITAGVAAYAFGMLTYDAFAFIQVTFLLFILVGIGAALLAEKPTPRPVGARSRAAAPEPVPALGG